MLIFETWKLWLRHGFSAWQLQSDAFSYFSHAAMGSRCRLGYMGCRRGDRRDVLASRKEWHCNGW